MYNLKGKKGLITGVANDKSIAYAVAKAVRALGGEIALTYQNDKTAMYTRPLAESLGARLFEKLDVRNRTQASVLLRSLQLTDPARRVADE